MNERFGYEYLKQVPQWADVRPRFLKTGEVGFVDRGRLTPVNSGPCCFYISFPEGRVLVRHALYLSRLRMSGSELCYKKPATA
jgi:hypothetical protein